MTITLKLNLAEDCIYDVILYWRSYYVFEEEVQTHVPCLWNVSGLGVNSILSNGPGY